jgi:flagella basal body P-ring formation protein FlgA
MSSKAVTIVVVGCLMAVPQFCRGSANSETGSLQKDSALEVYLPREVTIKDDAIRLGRVGIIRGVESLVARAGEIVLGRISVPGQEVVVDRSMVLSRLACNGIPASKVTLTGAEKITVKQQQRVIKGREFVELASSFLMKNPPVGLVCELNPIRMPKDLVVRGADKDIKLLPRLAGSGARNRARVQIAVFVGGREIAVREVTFRLKYNRRRAVTLVEFGAGAVISPENIKIESTVSNYPEPADWSPPYGLVTRRRVAANTVLRPNMVGSAESAVIVGRNQTVVIRVERPGLLVTAIGKTMQQARAGDYIKVRNVDSRRIILAKVNEDGTVEPVF